MKARLVESREIAPNTRHFEFEPVDWTPAFVPGQFLSVTAQIGDDEVTRAYSICSPPFQPTFSFCANLVTDGRFSPLLFALPISGEIDFKGPYGAFILRRTLAESIFVATGTGIAPFRSMLHVHLREFPATRFTLVFGVRHEHGLMYNDELVQLAREYPNFDYRPTLTRPTETWTGLTGRVQPHVLELLGDRRDMDVYMCGMKEMVDEMRGQLKAIALDRKRIIYEKYD